MLRFFVALGFSIAIVLLIVVILTMIGFLISWLVTFINSGGIFLIIVAIICIGGLTAALMNDF